MTRRPISPALQPAGRTQVWVAGRKLLYFSGCDYYRMASRREVLRAAERALRTGVLNVAASRLTTGNHVIYEQLEAALARFFGAESALLVNSGYNAGMTVAQALQGRFSHVLVDERAHPALQDATRFLEAPTVRFAHRSAADLQAHLTRIGEEARVIVLTDGLFSHNGSVPPLKEYASMVGSQGWLLVDDSHGAGVLGNKGRGTLELAGLSRRRVIQTITLSKAFGAHGGAILGSASLRSEVVSKSHMFAGQTPTALPLAAAALKALEILRNEPDLRARLHINASRVKAELGRGDLSGPDFPGPIIPLIPSGPAHATRLNRALREAGIFPPFIRYPGGPSAGYFRFVISSEHTPRDLDRLIGVLKQHGT